MPASFDNDFAMWLTQHGQERAQAVNVLHFVHPAFGSRWICDYGEDFAALTRPDALGTSFIAVPVGFTFEFAADNLTTQQQIVLRMDNVHGLVTSMLRAFTLDDFQTPLAVTYRAYLDTKRRAPAYDPITLYATDCRMVRAAVEIELSADQLPNVTAGIRYTFDRFPPLVLL